MFSEYKSCGIIVISSKSLIEATPVYLSTVTNGKLNLLANCENELIGK